MYACMYIYIYTYLFIFKMYAVVVFIIFIILYWFVVRLCLVGVVLMSQWNEISFICALCMYSWMTIK